MAVPKPLAHKSTSSPRKSRQQAGSSSMPQTSAVPVVLLRILVQIQHQFSTETLTQFICLYLKMVEEYYPQDMEDVIRILEYTSVMPELPQKLEWEDV